MTGGAPGVRRIAVVQPGLEAGGAQNLWAHAFTDPSFADFEKCILLPAGGRTRLSDAECRAARITVREYGGRTARVMERAARRVGAKVDPLSRAISAVDPGLVWFNLAGLGEIGWIGAAAAHCTAHAIPYWLIVQHVHEEFFFASDAAGAAAREVATRAVRVLTVSARNRESIAVAFGDRLPNVEHAVNGVSRAFLNATAPIAERDPPRITGTARFISPARLDPEFKGQHLLFAAFADHAWAARDWHLTLQGGGEHGALLQRLVGFFGLPRDRVTFAPHTGDIAAAFAAADVIVMPSLSEGSPFALAEGMACGRPAMGTPVGGIDELVRDGETGWLARSTEPGDVAAALERCWSDRSAWPRLGAAARAHVERHYDLTPAHAALLSRVRADSAVRQQRPLPAV